MISKTLTQRSLISSTNKSLIFSTEIIELIKLGRSYFCSIIFDILTAAKKYVLFDPTNVVPNLPDFNGIIIAYPPTFFASLGPVVVNFRIGHDYSGGTLISLNNMNELSLNTTLSEIKENPTGSTLGTIKSSFLIGGGDTAIVSQQGGSNDIKFPFVINKNIPRLIEIDNQSGKDIKFQFSCIVAEF